MTDEQRHLARIMLRTHDVRSTLALMNNSLSGKTVLYREIDAIRRGMTTGKNAPDHLHYGEPGITAEASACADLLRAQLRTGQHWITDQARFVAACESVGIAA